MPIISLRGSPESNTKMWPSSLGRSKLPCLSLFAEIRGTSASMTRTPSAVLSRGVCEPGARYETPHEEGMREIYVGRTGTGHEYRYDHEPGEYFDGIDGCRVPFAVRGDDKGLGC